MQSNHSEIHKIDGVGVDLNRFQPCGNLSHRLELRHRLGFKEGDFIVTVVAELNKNKNQIVLVKAALVLKAQIPCLKVLLIGKETAPDVRRYVDAHSLNDVVLFLGYRNDVEKILSISDVGFSASLREGLPVNIIESMACGLPILCSDNRGHRALISHLETGLIFDAADTKSLIDFLVLLYKNPALRQEMGQRNVSIAKKFSLDEVLPRMQEIYMKVMK